MVDISCMGRQMDKHNIGYIIYIVVFQEYKMMISCSNIFWRLALTTDSDSFYNLSQVTIYTMGLFERKPLQEIWSWSNDDRPYVCLSEEKIL